MSDEYDVTVFICDVGFIYPVVGTDRQILAFLTAGWIRFVDVTVYQLGVVLFYVGGEHAFPLAEVDFE